MFIWFGIQRPNRNLEVWALLRRPSASLGNFFKAGKLIRIWCMGSHFIPCHILDGPQKNYNELNFHGMTRMAFWSPEHRNGVWKTGRGRESGFVCGSLYFLLNHSFIRKLVKTGLFSQSIKTEMQGIPTIAGSFKCTWSCQQFFH